MGDVAHRDADKTLAELRTQLNKAYLSGDGGAVERAMAQLADAERTTADRAQYATR
jgi:hypothetical protein